MYEKYIIYRVEYYSWLQATTEGVVMYMALPMEKGEQLYWFILTSVKSGLKVSRSFNVKWKNLN